MSITGYTVILGDYDNLRPPQQAGLTDRYVCFSDRPRSVAPWEMQSFPMLFGLDDARNCRIPKCLPHLLMDTEFSVYMDGAFQPRLPLSAAVSVLRDADIALFAHPGGHTSYHDERDFYLKRNGFVPEHVEKTYQGYCRELLPVTGEFYAGGLIIRRHNAMTARFNEIWFNEYANGSLNDQFGLYSAIVRSGIKVATIPGVATMDLMYFAYCLHADSGCGDNPGFEGENRTWAERRDRIRSLMRPSSMSCARDTSYWLDQMRPASVRT